MLRSRRNFTKYDNEYVWAKATLKDLKKALCNKTPCFDHAVDSLISDICEKCCNKEAFNFICELATTYLECVQCISEFQKKGDMYLLPQIDQKISAFKSKTNFYSKNKQKKISSPIDLLKEFECCLESYCGEMENLRFQTIQSAKSYLNNHQNKITPKHVIDDLNYNSSKLPNNLYIGKHIVDSDSFSQLLFDNNVPPCIFINSMYKGNLYIRDFDNNINSIDKFIVAYVFSCLNEFPLGALRIHIIDKSPGILTILENKLNDKSNKKLLTTYKDFSILDTLTDIVCKDLSKKIGPNCRNIYELYKTDKSVAINLVIIKAPLSQNSNYELGEALERIKVLSGEYGHNCGMRFLIIDTAMPLYHNSNKVLFEIKKHCGITAEKTKNKFSIAGLSFDPITFKENELSFIELQCNKILSLLAKAKQNAIKYEEIVNCQEKPSLDDAILRIPIGKSANTIIEMPFSCKNISGTAEGMCVSYMVIGATGSGKSSLFDSVLMCGSMKYSPKDLQFWLLDFKDGVATEKYKNSQLPHISVVADKNSPSDALSLFSMIQSEMTNRKEQFKKYSGCSDIYTFNQIAERRKENKMPRIIILIDEIQELMNCEYQSDIIRELISISNRIRAFGLHLIMIAQNLSDGKNNLLQEVLSQVNGRICFRIDNEDTLRNSSIGESFTNRFSEIKNLGQGEIYLKFGNMDEPQKLQLAYVPPTSFENVYFPTIRSKYNIPAKTRIIGETSKLMLDTYSNYLQKRYSNVLGDIQRSKQLDIVLGENAYTHEPLVLSLSEKQNSSICFIGSNKEISNSLIVSTLISLAKKEIIAYVFNGDSSSMVKDIVHKLDNDNIFYRTRGELHDVLSSLYSLFLERRKMEDDEAPPCYEPIILCINDATGIRIIREDISMDEFSSDNSYDVKTVINILNELATEGYRYKIFVVISVTEDTFNDSIVSNIANMVVFNNTNFVPLSINGVLYSDMLQSIAGEGTDSLGLYLFNKTFTKFRPLQYNLEMYENFLTYIEKGTKK